MTEAGAEPRRVPLGWTEVLVGVHRPGAVAREGRASARATVTEAVAQADGRGHPAILAVLADHVLAAAVRAAETGLTAIATTQMHVDVLGPLPAAGEPMVMDGRPLQTFDEGGCASVVMDDGNGRPLAHATGWFIEVKEGTPSHHEGFFTRAARDAGTAQRLATVLRMDEATAEAPAADRRPRAGDRLTGPRFDFDDELLNENGTLHGGALTMAALLAAEAVMPDAEAYTLQSFSVDFLRGGAGAMDTTVHVRHGGRRFRSFSVEVSSGGRVCTVVDCAYRLKDVDPPGPNAP